ncbi:MAG: hypothetical protein AOA65_0124 [Candidatus Bathyarchaeota archaeon BA1]|nr:MAG: hypothetical protein AOA65_0124 [Candidatus Bathyarchaeota archaeon BA1]
MIGILTIGMAAAYHNFIYLPEQQQSGLLAARIKPLMDAGLTSDGHRINYQFFQKPLYK